MATKTTTKAKTAKITAARALDIRCEKCDCFCVDFYGSTLITEESDTVTCEQCGAEYVVPVQAFRVVYRPKLQEKKS